MRPAFLRSVRAKLMALSLGLVVVPGAVVAFLASSSATAALERAVGRQLATVASDGAQALASVIEAERARLAGWAGQEIMREVVVGDVDKRISRFLLGQRDRIPMLLDAVVVDAARVAVAATDPAVLGTSLPAARGAGAARPTMTGPRTTPRHDGPVLDFAVAIPDPDDPGATVGTLRATYDWRVATAPLAAVRAGIAALGSDVALLVVDDAGRAIGGTEPPGEGGVPRAVAWAPSTAGGPAYGVAGREDALVGRARLGLPDLRWSVLAVEPRADALAPLHAMRRRLVAILMLVVLLGLAIAAFLAHRMAQPLRVLTRATAELSRVGAELQALPVRSQDEIGQLTAAFNRMAADLRRAHDDLVATARLASVGEIAAGIAHEVRTPLGILRGSAQMLGRALQGDGARERELIDMIVGEVDRIERVVSGLTELAKPHAPAIEPTPLVPLLTRVADFVAGQARGAGIAVRVAPAAGPCTARCDPEQIYQVVLNLVVNALQAQPAGGEVRLRALAGRDGRVGFEVSDDGPGVAPEARALIFAPFYTRREGGTGLGLALVERIVRAHGGTVTVASALGAGATFHVELPRGDGA